MAIPVTQNPLDHPIWHALSSTHASFAEGNDLAKRYPVDVSPLAAIQEQSDEAYDALRQLLANEDIAVLFLGVPPHPPADWRLVQTIPMEQMVCDIPPAIMQQDYEIKVLNLSDVPDMKQLAELTEPGPFRKRTIDFGGYLGVRDSGRLVAMAGYRIRPAGFTEVSAVCTHPDYRGRGYAKALVSTVAHSIIARGEIPFLGVRHDNTSAIRLYEKLGFKIRQRQYVAVLKKSKKRSHSSDLSS